MTAFKLRFPRSEIRRWASEYSASDVEAEAAAGRARKRGFLTLAEFMAIGDWKTSRSRKKRALNSEEYVRAVTRAALGEREPRFKIEALRMLDGVDWPTASVILHLCDRQRWPIVDFRAFWSLTAPAPGAGFRYEDWAEYTAFTRRVASETGVKMRMLDRALWAYSKANQA